MAGESLRWPPPGLERMQGDLPVIAARFGLAGALLVIPLLFVVAREEELAAFGPFADSWWIVVVLGTIGLAFALDGITRVARTLKRSAHALDRGYRPATVLSVLADRNRDMGFLVTGARHFSVLQESERGSLGTLRMIAWVLLAGAGLWLIVGLVGGLFLAARGTLSPGGLQAVILLPAVVLYLIGGLASMAQDVQVRRARRVWHKQPWSEDLAAEEVRAWQEAAGTGSATTSGRGLALAAKLVLAFAVIVLIPVLPLMPASAVGPILTEISAPAFQTYHQRGARAEAFRSYRVEGDVAITPTDAGSVLHNLLYVGVEDDPPVGEREPDVRVAQSWFPSLGDGPNPMGVETYMWGDSLFNRVADGVTSEQRAYLASVADHPSQADFSRLAAATSLDAGSARWDIPFPSGVTMATIPIPRFSSFREAAQAHIGAAAFAWASGRDNDAERMLKEVVSAGFLLADDGPTLIDNLIGFVLVDAGGTALGDFYRVSGRAAAAAELSRIRAVAEANADRVQRSTPSSNDAMVRSLYAMSTDTTIARGLRWEYFINLATIGPCLNLNRIVFGVGESFDSYLEEVRATLVRWPSDEALFEIARHGWIGATDVQNPSMLRRIAGLYMHSGENSCSRYVQHMQAADLF